MSDPFERLRRERSEQQRGADLTPRPASASSIEIVEIMEIVHANNAGNVHGGTVMRLVDTATGTAAARHCRRRVVTASMDEMSFLEPVFIGDIVHVRAQVNEAFRSSMEVGARVDVESIMTGEFRHVATAYLTFVALDEEMRPIPVPPVLAETDEERRRQAQAGIRREQRLLRKQALQQHLRAQQSGGTVTSG